MPIETYLNRINENDEGTGGIFSVPSLKWSCFSLELPDRNNQRNYSRINSGRYLCKWTQTVKFGVVPLLQNVEGRDGILIHVLNYAGDIRKGYLSDTEGCIGLGDALSKMKDQKAILNSKMTLSAFEKLIGKQDFYINIK